MIRRIGNGVAGAVVAGTLIGLAEAIIVLKTSASGDMVVLPYAAVLYALIGLALGVGLGIGTGILGLVFKKLRSGHAWALGFSGVAGTLGVAIALYVANKNLYAEEGVPMQGKLVILGAVVVLALVMLTLGAKLLDGPLSILTKPAGVVGLWALLAAGSWGVSKTVDASSLDGVRVPAKKATAALADRPNVIVIVIDTLRADYLGSYGSTDGSSPNMDALAKDGLVFDELVTSASWTRASFASLYTSMLPSAHTCSTKVSTLPDDVDTVAEVMSQDGYATGGLPDNINVTRSFNFQQGFDWFSYQALSNIAGATESASQLSMYNVVRKLRDIAQGDKKTVTDYYQPADVVLGNSLSWFKENTAAGNKTFMVAHLMEVHDPYFRHPYDGYAVGRAWHPEPDASEAAELKDLYRGEIKYADEQIGSFVQGLKDAGLYDNTLIIVTADHGEEFNEHGGWWHGVTLYDEMIHVPLIMKLPNSERAGQRMPWQVRQIDIAPTIAAMAGATPSPRWEGKSMLDAPSLAALDALYAPPAPVDQVGTEGEAAVQAPVAPDTSTLARAAVSEEDFEGNVLSSIRAQGWKYIRANQGNPHGLPTQAVYDLGQDPGEQKNLAESEAGRRDQLQSDLDATIAAAGKGGVTAETEELSCEDCNRLMMLGYMSDCTQACGK